MARSLKKGPYVDPSLQRKVDRVIRSGTKQVVRTWSRRSMITPEFVGLTFHVHNGKLFPCSSRRTWWDTASASSRPRESSRGTPPRGR